MSWLKAGQVAFMAYDAVKGYVQKTTEQEIRNVVTRLVRQHLDQLVVEINRRSLVYIVLSVISLVVYIFGQLYPQYELQYIIALLLLVSTSIYLLSRTVQVVRRWLGYIANIETMIDESIRQNLKIISDQGMAKKVMVWLSERSQADYRDRVIVDIVRSLSQWLRQNKSILVVRFIFMWIFMLLFVELLKTMLIRYL